MKDVNLGNWLLLATLIGRERYPKVVTSRPPPR
jgi:hypothetical protein